MAAGYNPATGRNSSMVGGGGFNSYAAGVKRYGTGRRGPNVGATAGAGMIGYGERDARNKARMNALQRQIGRI